MCDVFPDIMLACDTMSKLLCRASELKCDSYNFTNNPLVRPYCDMRTDLAIENAEHLLIHCPYFNDIREIMFKEIDDFEKYYDTTILTPQENILLTILLLLLILLCCTNLVMMTTIVFRAIYVSRYI